MKTIGIKSDRLKIKYDSTTGNIYCQYSPDPIGKATSEKEAIIFCKNNITIFREV